MPIKKNNKNKNNSSYEYVSLQDATKLCNYSQEYLSLRARQGKLKAVKFGRNWVTTKEWFEEYNQEYNHYVKSRIAAKQPILPSPPKFFGEKFRQASAPDNLPIEKFRLNLNLRELKPVFAFALVFVLIMAGGVFGKESFVKTYNDLAPIVQKIEQRIEQGIDKGAQFGLAAIEVIGDQEIPIGNQSVTVRETSKGIMGILKDYSQWTSDKILIVWQRAKNTPIARSYVAADNFVEDKLFSLSRTVLDNYLTANDFVEKKISTFLAPISQGYFVANNFVEEKLSAFGVVISDSYFSINKFVEEKLVQAVKNLKEGYRLTTKPFIKVYQLVTAPWKGLIPGKEFLVAKEKLEALRSEFEKFKEEPVVVKRIEVSKVVTPVKEITKEVETVKQITKVDDEALKQVRANMAYLEEEIGKRLYAPGGVISQTIYVTEPVSSPKIYQENGEIVLQTLGSGNVILSAATGLQLYGQQVVVESTNLLNPLIYLANKTKVGGTLTISGATSISGTLGVGGAASIGGDLTVTGNFSLTGNQTISGVSSISASSTSAILTLTQTGTGDILNLVDGSTEVLTVLDGGNVGIATSTPSTTFAVQGNMIGSGNMVLYGQTTSTIADSFIVDTNTLFVDSYGNQVGIGTAEPFYALDVLGTGKFSTQVGIAGTATTTGTSIIFAGAGNITTAAASTWKTTAGNLTITSEAGHLIATGTDIQLLASTGDISATSSNAIYFATNNAERLRINSNGYVGIGTTTLAGLLTVGTTTPALVVSPLSFVGIGTSTPSTNLSVVGNIMGSGNMVLYGAATSTISGPLELASSFRTAGNIYPSADVTYMLGSPSARWANIYAAATTIGGTVTIDTDDVRASGLLTIWATDMRLFASAGDISATSSNDIYFATNNTERMRINSNGYVGIGTTTLTGLLTVGTSTPAFVVAANNYIGIGTSTPSEALTVVGNIVGTGNMTITGTYLTLSGSIMPDSPGVQDIGSADYDWRNIYGDNIYANNIYAASTTIAGTVAEMFTINSDATTSDATSTLRFYRGVNPHALINWDAGYDRFNFNFPLYLSGTGSITAASALNLTGNAASTWETASGSLTVQSADVLIASSTGAFIFGAGGSEVARFLTSGNLGLGTTNASTTLHILSTAEQLRLANTAQEYVSFTVASDGALELLATGTDADIEFRTKNFNDAIFIDDSTSRVGIASSTPSDTFAVQGNMLGIGNLVISGTLNTGQGATEVYLMNQDVQTTNNVTFATVNTGQGAYELYAMDQNVRTTDSVTFANLTLTYGITSATTTITATSTLASINADSGLLYVDAYTNRVGIASSTPSDTFAVQGNMLGVGNLVLSGTINTGQGATEVYLMDQAVQTTNNVTFATVNTGQGAYELYAMDQDVLTTSPVTFLTVNTGQGANELFAMDQPVRTTDSVTFANLTLTYGITAATSTITATSTLSSINADSGLLYVDAYTNRVGIGTTTLAGLLTVGTSTPALVVSPTSQVGIATSTPSAQFAVAGNILGSGNIVLYGTEAAGTATSSFVNIQPSADAQYLLGSSNYKWANIYAATTTIGSGSLVIGPTTLTTPDTLTISAIGNLTTTSTGDIILVAGGSERARILSTGNVGIATTTPAYPLVINNASANAFIINSSGQVIAGTWQGTAITDAYIPDTITASNYLLKSDWFTTTTQISITSIPTLSITESQISNLGNYLTYTAATSTYLQIAYASTTYLQISSTTPYKITSLPNLSTVGTLTTAAGNISLWTNDSDYINWTQASSTYIPKASTTLAFVTSIPGLSIIESQVSNLGNYLTYTAATSTYLQIAYASTTYLQISSTTPYKITSLPNLSLTEGWLLVGNNAGVASATSTIFVNADNGNVGIGTAGPSSKLTVFGGNLVVGDGTATTTITNTTLTVANIGAFTATGAINFGSQDMTNVDIDSGTIDGTTITGGTIQGSPSAGTGLTMPAFTLGGTVTGGSQIITNLGGISLVSGARIYPNVNTGDLYLGGGLSGIVSPYIYLGGTEHGSAGSIYIASPDTAKTSPLNRLHISGDLDTAIATWSNVTHTGMVLSGVLDTGNQWLSGDGGAEGIMIDDSGNVGIGNASPTSKLTVNGGDFKISSTGAATTTISSNVSTFAGGLISQASSTFVGNIDVNGNITISSSTGTLYQPIWGSDDGLVLYLPFSEGMTSSSANIAYDRSPYGNDGTATNMPMPGRNATSGESGWATTTCKVPGCMSFDGVNDGVSIPASATQLDFTSQPFSIIFWMNVDNLTDYHRPFDRSSLNAAGYTSYTEQTTGKFIFETQFAGNHDTSATGNGAITAGTWYYVGIIRNGTSVRIFINGVDSTVTAGTHQNPVSYSGVAYIGRYYQDIQFFDGLIDEVRIYNRALSADEIRVHYLRGTGAGGAVVADKFRIIGTDNNVDFIVNTGNVGIGTTEPKRLLDVRGTANIGNTIAETGGGSSPYSSIHLRTYSGAASSPAKIEVVDSWTDIYSTYTDGIRLRNWSTDGVVRDLMTILGTGNVGIGNTGPTSKLTVNGGDFAISSTGAATTTISSATSTFAGPIVGGGASFIIATTTSNILLQPYGGGVGIATSSPAQLFTINSAATSAFVVTSAGLVGIGTTNPTYRLTLAGDENTRIKIDGSSTAGIYLTQSGSDAGTIRGDTGGIQLFAPSQGPVTMYLKSTGNVGIGTTTPATTLDVYGNVLIDGVNRYLNFNSVVGTNGYGFRDNAGAMEYKNTGGSWAGIGTGGGGGGSNWKFLTVNAITPTSTIGIIVNASSTIASTLDITSNLTVGGYVGIGTTTPYSKLTINESDDFAFGSFNEKVIDSMEGSALYWTRSASISTSTESSIVKVGGQSLKFTASSTEDAVVRKTFGSPQDWSAYERISFWIYADRLATSTATTTQLLTFQIYDANNPSMIQHKITFQKEDRWQYEEVVLNATGTAAYDGVTYIQFRTDFGDIEDINFYVDQIRAYNSTERSAEMFVDRDGTLVVTGRNGVELVAPQAGAGTLPGVKVGGAVVELGQPLSVNVGGDVGFDYDIQFLSTGLSQITSEGPLRIIGGDPNHAENLTLTVGGTGDIIVELANASSSFMITQAAYTTTTAFIINSEMNATTSASNGGVLMQVISDYGSDENVVFTIDAGGSIRYDMSAKTPASDVAENYYVEDETINGGDVVCLNSIPLTVEKCRQPYQSGLVGVVSTLPALLMAGDLENSRPVTLVGRVPVKVSTENGPIAIGDSLTSASSSPGVAMKATGSGKILGYALEEYNPNATNSDPNATNMILAFINLDERGSGDLTVQQNGNGKIEIKAFIDSSLATIFSIDEEGAMKVGKLKADEIEVQRGITIYDRVTSEPYCIYMENGQMMTATGTCAIATSTNGLTPDVSSSTSSVGVCQNGANQPCSSEIGACQIGVEICEQGVWGECIGAVFPTDEICDEVDNDCDGQIDEGDVCSTPAPEPIITATTTPDISTTTATTTQ